MSFALEARGAPAAHDPSPKIAGRRLVADLSGALFDPESATLLVADLHLEKGSAFAARRRLLPPYDTSATLARLEDVIARRLPRRVVALGDSFHDQSAEARLDPEDRRRLAALLAGRDWLWILGNHDPTPPRAVGGDWAREGALGSIALRHEPAAASDAPQIAGHLHPCARVRVRGRTQRRRCFVTDGRSMILPAFGAYAGGLNVRDDAFRPLLASLEAWVLGRAAVRRISGPFLVSE